MRLYRFNHRQENVFKQFLKICFWVHFALITLCNSPHFVGILTSDQQSSGDCLMGKRNGSCDGNANRVRSSRAESGVWLVLPPRHFPTTFKTGRYARINSCSIAFRVFSSAITKV